MVRGLLAFLFGLLFASATSIFEAYGATTTERCVGLLQPEERAFAGILHGKNQNFHVLHEVTHEQNRFLRRGVRVFDPAEKIGSFLKALERVHQRASLDQRVKERLRASYHDRFLIKPEDVPESYFKHQQRLALERGHGHVEVTTRMRAENIRILIEDQKKSLDVWFDYFLSRDADAYPFYVKYWSFTSMLKLSKLDLERGEFLKRSRSTVAPFPELNREALARIADSFAKKLRGEAIDADQEWERLLSRADFGKLYARELKRLRLLEMETQKQRRTIVGRWVRYPRNSDPTPLVKSLEEKNTGWCTAGESTAKEQLKEGDFHVFYSLDSKGEPTVPRVAIRMEEDSIVEIRGVAKDQNLDDAIAGSNVLEEKLKEFGTEGHRYRKKESNMKRLTEIVRKTESSKELSREELRFLYEVDSRIEGFGSKEDPRIAEVLSKRNARKDLAGLLNVKENQISFTRKEALRGGIQFHHGDLDLSDLKNLEGELPRSITGDLYLDSLESGGRVKLPDSVGGDLYFSDWTSAEGVSFPRRVGGGVYLFDLETAKDVRLPQSVGGDLWMARLEDTKGVVFPRSIGGDLYLFQRTIDEKDVPEFLRSLGKKALRARE